VFEPAERERFIEDGLIGDFESIGLAFTNMRVKNARCFDAGDEAMINREIEQNVPGRHTTLDAMVAEQLHAWLAKTALEAVQERSAARQQDTDWEAFAKLLYNTGSLLHDEGELEKALETYEQALEINKANLGPRHTSVADTLNNMAGVFYMQGKLDKALETYEQALEINKANLGPRHTSVANTLNNMAFVTLKPLAVGELL
jgi:tetratricopeptide (TPR) repeat protein